MKKLSGSSYSLIFVILVMLSIIGLSQKLSYFSSRLLPTVIGSIVLLLAVIALAREIKTERNPEAEVTTDKTGTEENSSPGLHEYIDITLWILGFTAAIYIVGFIIATPLFIAAYMKTHGSKWRGTVITAVIFSGIFYTLFNILLNADLYKGKLLIWLDL